MFRSESRFGTYGARRPRPRADGGVGPRSEPSASGEHLARGGRDARRPTARGGGPGGRVETRASRLASRAWASREKAPRGTKRRGWQEPREGSRDPPRGERIREPTRGRARTETSPSPRRRSSARTWPPSRPALAVPLGRVPRAVASDDFPCRERRRDWNRKGHEIVSNVPFSSATGGDTRRGIRARPRRVLGLDDDDVNPTCIDTIHRSLKVKVHLDALVRAPSPATLKVLSYVMIDSKREERFFFASRRAVGRATAHAATPPPSLRRPFRSSFRNDTKPNAYL